MKIRIQYSSSFYRKMRKLIRKKPQIACLYQNAITLLLVHPAPQSLKAHKLSGQLKNTWAFSLTHDLRITFEKKGKTIKLIDVGSHDEVY